MMVFQAFLLWPCDPVFGLIAAVTHVYMLLNREMNSSLTFKLIMNQILVGFSQMRSE
jgi:hypothetical protein